MTSAWSASGAHPCTGIRPGRPGGCDPASECLQASRAAQRAQLYELPKIPARAIAESRRGKKNSLLPAGFDLRRAAACGDSGCYRRTDLPFVNGTERSRALHTSLKRDLSQCIRTWKTSFASALTRSGPRVVAHMARPISIGLRPSGKS